MASPDTAAPATPSRRARLRGDMEQKILLQAEEVFAQLGFDGASINIIAERAGVSKQNLLYYYPNKLSLYKRVLDDVMSAWLQSLDALAHTDLPPAEALDAYIDAKIDFSVNRPNGSRVYALEIIGGARNYGKEIKARLVPMLHQNIATLESWMEAGLADQVSAEHLIFAIWASTQAYADFSSQMQLVLGKKRLTSADQSIARATLKTLVKRTLKLEEE
ncbi:TetR family transcriptional regulator C-terminal domain-containing protein [Caballeronia sp. LZ035]|uniref:TetR family transcriptional regulator C-terminal domain-containing protein n=1 Tax=Caballeronia sp. LZ035 TaxID=3038568 RepID=UPI002866CF5F|nr:TetR family transcriptional regulator C-terminal domain-containing protein [Caballeronia sp. LZ035]MDR5761391.1 TetR family transcriptional regulator C-terminal domain-containing protein [Caballeronia sp. LZ035]